MYYRFRPITLCIFWQCAGSSCLGDICEDKDVTPAGPVVSSELKV